MRRLRTDGKKALPATARQHAAVTNIMQDIATTQRPIRKFFDRVVESQRPMQAMPIALLQPEFFNEAPYVLRALPAERGRR
jgi:hypothetical protein